MRHGMAAIAGAGALALLAAPPASEAEQPARGARVGILLFSNPQADFQLATFRQGLRDLGYVEGQNITLEYRFAEGRAERLPGLAADLVRLRPDVILALGGDVAASAKRATDTVPVVFASSADPVQLGLVAGLARPGGNATGVTFILDELAGKRIQLLQEAAPRISRVAILWNPDHLDPDYREAERAARTLHLRIHSLEVRGPEDFDGAFKAAVAARADALSVVSSRLTMLHHQRIVEFAAKHHLPLAGGWGAWAQAGGLLSYGPNLGVMTRRAATYVDKILKGAKPADLPVEQPTRFELFINLKTAKALGLTIPRSILIRADQVIQ